ncbi:trypsin-like serine protease [Alcanivoracaceae bacterium MT1]
MRFRKGALFSAPIFTLIIVLFPTTSLAIALKNDGANREAPYPSFLANIRVATQDGSGSTTNTTGTGAFIAPNLVVTAAHLVVPHSGDESKGIVVSGVRRNGTAFAERVKGVHYASGFPVPYHPGYPVGSDVAVLELHSPIFGLDILHLPDDLGVNVGQQDSIVGTVYGQMTPSRERIEQAYDRLFTPEGEFTDEGRREFEERADGPERLQWMPSEIAINAANRSAHPWKDGAPFIRIQVPRSGDDAFSGEAHIMIDLNMDTAREQFVSDAYYMASHLPFHQGDSGAPFISITENGEAYLAGVLSDERSKRHALGFTLVRPRVSSISTGRVSDILMRMGPDGARTDKEGWGFWSDPNNTVAHVDNWDERGGDTKLIDVPEPPDVSYQKTCESSDSGFCRYLRSEPTREYLVKPVSMEISGASPSDRYGAFSLMGTIGYFSPQNDPDHISRGEESIFDTPGPYVMNFPGPGNRKKLWKTNMTLPDGGYVYSADLYPSDGAEEAIITANASTPMICLNTENGIVDGEPSDDVFGVLLIGANKVQCTTLDESTRRPYSTLHDVSIVREGQRYGSYLPTITVQFHVEPKQ